MQPIRDLNDLANEATRREGGKQNLSVAQVKEVIRCVSDIFAEVGFWRFLRLALHMRKHAQERRKKQAHTQLNIKFE